MTMIANNNKNTTEDTEMWLYRILKILCTVNMSPKTRQPKAQRQLTTGNVLAMSHDEGNCNILSQDEKQNSYYCYAFL